MANKTQTIRDNAAALKVATDIIRTARPRTAEDVEILKKYRGFGGIKELAFIEQTIQGDANYEQMAAKTFAPDVLAEVKMLEQTIRECSDSESEAVALAHSVAASTDTAYYTPNEVVTAIGGAVQHTLGAYGIKAETMLDPSAGSGKFLAVACAGMKTTAFEIDAVTARVLWTLNPDTDVFNHGFETIDKQTDEQGNPLGKFDVTASNIPFGLVELSDVDFAAKDNDHRRATQKLHTYFFMKAMERLNNGGILAFITSRGTSDAADNRYLREWMIRNGNLLSAVRLPDNMFSMDGGIEIGSDLIVFQRDEHKGAPTLQEQMWCDSIDKEIAGQMVDGVNRLLCLPSMALYTDFAVRRNQYGKMMPTYKWKKSMAELSDALCSRLSNDMERAFRKSAWLYGHDTLRQSMDALMARRANKNVAALQRNNAAAAAKRTALRPAYDRLVKAYLELQTSERTNRQENVSARRELNAAYDDFCLQAGGNLHLNEPLLGKFYPEYVLALSLENRETDGSYHKADVFKKPIAFRVIDPNEVFSPKDAMQMSLNQRGVIDLAYMCKLAHCDSAVLCEALKEDMFLMPTTLANGIVVLKWLPKEMAISANVIEKRKRVERYMTDNCEVDYELSAYLNRTIDALREATPKPIAFDDIQIPFGARWLPTEFFSRFYKKLMGADIKVNYIAEHDLFSVKVCSCIDYRIEIDYRVAGRKSDEVMTFALKDQFPSITKKVGDATFTDHEANRKMQKTINGIRERWNKFIRTNDISKKERERIEVIYNETFNNSPMIKYDGSKQTFDGLCLENLGIADLYQSQKDAIWMIKSNYENGAVCWHEVGGGKTLIAVTAAMDGRRLGLWTKPMIIGMKANVDQIYETARKAYPTARILYPGKEDFKKENKIEFFNRIANNDWDLIVLSHTQFKEIPQDADIERSMMEAELADMQEAYRLANKDSSMSSRALDGMRKKLKNLEASLETLNEQMKKQKRDGVVTFADMNVGMIFVDEYQEFKNLKFQTKHDRLAGLGNTQGSQRAWNLLLAIRTIQKRTGHDGGAVFMSGTIITNALTELYVLFKYLRPNALLQQGIRCFDAWMGIFAEKSTEYELSVTGEIKEKERIRIYKNVPELVQQLNVICDYRSAEMIHLDRPTPTYIQDFAEPTAEQETLIQNLVQFANTQNVNVLGIDDFKTSSGDTLKKSIMLIATGIANKVALDPRLLNATQFSDNPNSKLSRCAARIADYYKRYNEHRGVQFVFSNLGTYDKQHKSKWNVYTELRRKLVEEYGIPQKEIAFIHDWDTPQKKLKLFDALNNGVIRVVMGSTDKLGTGVNAQQRAVAAHHLDVPWRPSDMEQRNGRVIRKGNEVKMWANNNVDIIVYGTERTLDAYKYSLLNSKQTFIKQIADGSITTRVFDEGAMDCDSNGGETMNFAEYVALLSGNQDLMAKAKLDARIAVLEAERNRHEEDKRRAAGTLERIDNDIARYTAEQQQYELALRKVNGSRGKLVLSEAKDQSETEMGRFLFAVRDNHSMGREVQQVGTWHGFPITASCEYGLTGEWMRTEFRVEVLGNSYLCSESGALGNSHHAAVTYFDGLPEHLQKMVNAAKNSLLFSQSQRRSTEYNATHEWQSAEELERLVRERDTLDNRIKAELSARDEAKRKQDEAAAEAAAKKANEKSAKRRSYSWA